MTGYFDIFTLFLRVQNKPSLTNLGKKYPGFKPNIKSERIEYK